jgi:hypothetical protein
MGVDDIIFHPSLLTSWVADLGANHHYYANLGPLLYLNGSAWLLCLFVVVSVALDQLTVGFVSSAAARQESRPSLLLKTIFHVVKFL